MIYKDTFSKYDTEKLPGARAARCLNCGHYCDEHYGWACLAAYDGYSFKDIPWEYRFLTNGMQHSLLSTPAPYAITDPAIIKFASDAVNGVSESKDIPEWRISRNDRPGECACGIVRSTCDYHR